MKSSERYRKFYTVILLTGYLFFTALSIFHYHSIDDIAGSYRVEGSSPENTAVPLDKVEGITGECLVTHFWDNIDNLSFFPEICVKEDNPFTYISPVYPGKPILAVISENNLLRAPPFHS